MGFGNVKYFEPKIWEHAHPWASDHGTKEKESIREGWE
jgi:hypothetical protein